MVFYEYLFTPKLYLEYGTHQAINYEPMALENCGQQIISFLNIIWNIGYYSSPMLLTFLYRKGYIIQDSLSTVFKISSTIGILVALSIFIRGIGRSQNDMYRRFAKSLEEAQSNVKSQELKQKLRKFDFDFKYWPVDFDVESEGDGSKKKGNVVASSGSRFYLSPCQITAWLAIHTFGIRMIYPGSVKLIQKYLHPMLLQGRSKLVQDHGVRYKIKVSDGNTIDTMFLDNRSGVKGVNGDTLVICSEGNAGFYEIGIMVTPMQLNYSVIGWNHPGFGGSSGDPYPSQDQNAIDGVVQFAIHQLGFKMENIVFFGWSIGGFSSLWAASQYPETKGVILDATFDDLLQLALPRMPESISNIVKIAIRDYVNLNNTDLMLKYLGPILMVRRTEDEVICSEEMNIATNRGNYLLVNFLKYRFPLIFMPEQVTYAAKILSKSLDHNVVINDASNDQLCLSLIMSYVSENDGTYPLNIGSEYSSEQKNQLVAYLIKNHMLDFNSSHCTPLPETLFKTPWIISKESDFVFT